MQKRVLICLVVLAALLLPLFSACGFGGSDALEIESISAELLADGSGSTRITIKYFDNMAEPVIFDIPQGLQGLKGDQGEQGEDGEVGADGNGIKEVVIENGENGEQTFTFHYTNEDFEPTAITVKDGTEIKEIVRVEDEDTGESFMKVVYSDGTESEPILLPKGADGASFIGVNYDYDDTTRETLASFILSNGAEIGPIRIKPGKDGEGLKNELVQEEVLDENGVAIGVNLQFVLADGTVIVEKVFLPYGKNGDPGVGVAKLHQQEIKDDKGNVIGTRFYLEKTDGTSFDPIDVLNGVGVKDFHSVTLSDGKTMVTITLTNGEVHIFEVPAPVSIKDIVPGEDENGNTTLTIKTSDPENVPDITVTLQAANGIETIEPGESADGTQYQLIVHYTNGSSQVVSFNKTSAWHNGAGDPTPAMGRRGDYYFDQKNTAIWHKVKESTTDPTAWALIVGFHTFEKDVQINFTIDSSKSEVWSDASYYLSTKSFTLQVGQSWVSYLASLPEDDRAENAIPVPVRAGYVFAGWYVTRNPVPGVNAAFNDMTVIPNTESITLVPVWTPIP